MKIFLFILVFIILTSFLNAQQTILVGLYDNKPKAFINDNNEIQGFFPDLVNFIAEKENWQIHYIYGSWTECLERLENHEIDLMIDVAYSAERAEKYDFNKESVFNNWGLIYKRVDSKIASLSDLANSKIAVMQQSIHYTGPEGIKTLLDKFGIINYQFLEVGDYESVFKLLEAKQVDAGVVNRLFGNLHQNEYNIKKTDIVFNPVELRFAFPKNAQKNQNLIPIIDTHIIKLKDDPNSFLYQIIQYYFLEGNLTTFERNFIVNPSIIKPITLNQKEKQWIAEHPVIKLGVDPEFIPFEYFSTDNEYQGIASDYVRLINARLGLNMQVLNDLSWDQVIDMAKSRQIDVLPCVGLTTERKEYLLYSNPYVSFYRVIITRDEMEYVFSLNDLKDKRVCVQKNSSHHGYLVENTDLTPITYLTFEQCLNAVTNNQADVCVGNVVVATYWIKKLGLAQLKITAPLSSDIMTLHFAIRKDWPELVEIINKGLATITEQEQTSINNRWVKLDVEPMQDWKRIILISVIVTISLAALITIIIFWNRRLAREITLRKQAQKKIEEISITDELTKLYNRRYFNNIFEKEINRAKRRKANICFLMLDIDNFKKYNDHYGHKEGDNVLSRVGEKLKSLLSRSNDYAFRLGGEEFGIIFFVEDPKKALDFAQQICKAIEDIQIMHEKNDASPYVTASIGLAMGIPEKEMNADWFYCKADEALYAAKKAGRNRVVA